MRGSSDRVCPLCLALELLHLGVLKDALLCAWRILCVQYSGRLFGKVIRSAGRGRGQGFCSPDPTAQPQAGLPWGVVGSKGRGPQGLSNIPHPRLRVAAPQ